METAACAKCIKNGTSPGGRGLKNEIFLDFYSFISRNFPGISGIFCKPGA
jgi:hypothetical protein